MDIITLGIPGRLMGFITSGLEVGDSPPQVTVPNVLGETEADAITAIEALDLVPNSHSAYSSSVPAGDVITQSPNAGAQVSEGSVVNIYVSLGIPPDENRILLPIGPAYDLLQDVIYALPSRNVKVSANGAVQVSSDGVVWVVLTTGKTGATYMRNHDAPVVRVKLTPANK